MSDAPAPRPPLPDHLCTDARSAHYNEAVLEHEIVIRFNGKDRTDVDEYCISEGWIKVAAGKTLDRRGNALLIKLKGTVEAFYRADLDDQAAA
jgi:predicted house-cleaning NTP pyrophosphatase (Maf/HAM1 superfamily)